MRWTPGGVSEDVEDRRDEGGGGRRFGGGARLGLGGIIVLGLLSLVFKRDLITPFLGLGSGPGVTTSPTPRDPARDADERRSVQFVSFVLDDLQANWARIFAQSGKPYQKAKLVLFRDVIESPCGMAESATGPFYCPGDAKVYIDLGFYDELKHRFGAPGEFAQAYVIAHEIGHHIQRLTGIEEHVRRLQQQDPRSANAQSVRMELQADCFAGVWGNSTSQRKLIDQADIGSGLNAAAAIGDDRLQRQSTGRVSPEKFTHGSSAQRVEWFRRGLETGNVQACDTFAGR